MGSLIATLVAPLAAAIKQKVIAYALMVCAVLLVVFATAYTLDAAHSWLAFRYGPISASLSVAGALLVTAGVCVGFAFYIRGRPVSTLPAAKASLETYARLLRPKFSKTGVALAAAIAGGLTSFTAIASSRRLRSILSGRPSHNP